MEKKILLIDDDPLILKSVKRLFDKEGYDVETAEEPEEGIEKARNQDFNLIVCDIRMPGIDGIKLITQVKEYRKNNNKKDIPVILITGYSSEEAPIHAIKLGVKDYILKPFDIDKLLKAVKNILTTNNENQTS